MSGITCICFYIFRGRFRQLIISLLNKKIRRWEETCIFLIFLLLELSFIPDHIVPS
nr:MAG TPA: hypothetical protein [Caudoviricetes sp.]